MSMLRAGLTVGLLLIGAISALFGTVIIVSALKTGSISISYGAGQNSVAETISRASDAGRYYQYFIGLGLVPIIAGILAARWGWRAINR